MSSPADGDAIAHVFVDALEDQVEIGGDDGHHLRRARRLSLGERVTAADDTGAWRAYEVVELLDDGLRLDALGAGEFAPAPTTGVALAIALVKGGLDDVVAGTTELGVTRITPLRTERTVVRWDADRAARAVDRLRLVARSAAMQSRRARIPVVDDLATIAEVAARPDLVVADRGGRPAFGLEVPSGADWTVVIGPEGGLSAADLEPLAGRARLALGANVLRAATAPIAAVAVLVHRIAQNEAR